MTKKLTKTQKKMNAMMKGLAATWNCDGKCNGCEFEIIDEKVKVWANENNFGGHCGAIMIRAIANKLFSQSVSKRVKKLLYEVY